MWMFEATKFWSDLLAVRNNWGQFCICLFKITSSENCYHFTFFILIYKALSSLSNCGQGIRIIILNVICFLWHPIRHMDLCLFPSSDACPMKPFDFTVEGIKWLVSFRSLQTLKLHKTWVAPEFFVFEGIIYLLSIGMLVSC
jgi:hypothetical protein